MKREQSYIEDEHGQSWYVGIVGLDNIPQPLPATTQILLFDKTPRWSSQTFFGEPVNQMTIDSESTGYILRWR